MSRERTERPWSPEAEHRVLGTLLTYPEAAGWLAESQLRTEMFFDPTHRAAWQAVAELQAAGQPVDVFTVAERLQAGGQRVDSETRVYLQAVANSAVGSASFAHAARLIAERYLQRAVLDAADRAREVAEGTGDAAAKLDTIAGIFAGISRPGSTQAPRRLGELVRDRVTHWQALADGDSSAGIPTGLERLDDALGGGLKPGRVVVLAARPTIGKTSLASQVLLNVARAGHTALMLSQEMTAGELVDRAAANAGGIPLDRITIGHFAPDDSASLSAAAEDLAGLPLVIDDQPALSLQDIRAKCRLVQHRDGLAVVAVDYLQLCSAAGPVDRRHHQIEQLSRGLKQLAKDMGLCVLVLSQLNRGTAQQEPELHHLKESGAIEEDADVVCLLHPMGNLPDGALLMLCKVAKNRGGRRGRIALAFYGATQRWAISNGDVSRRKFD